VTATRPGRDEVLRAGVERTKREGGVLFWIDLGDLETLLDDVARLREASEMAGRQIIGLDFTGALRTLKDALAAPYPKPCPIPAFEDDPYTLGMALCDPSGIVTSYREGEQVQFPCTGHAHLYGEHIECTSPAHTSELSS
jgi:hypothetical protein